MPRRPAEAGRLRRSRRWPIDGWTTTARYLCRATAASSDGDLTGAEMDIERIALLGHLLAVFVFVAGYVGTNAC